MSVGPGRWNRPVLVLVHAVILLNQNADGMGRLFAECHDDFKLNPKDGPLPEYAFPWVGIIQYVHLSTGATHTGRAPRAVLIHRQFALATARDLTQLPKNYKLDKIVFGQYERDEHECELTQLQIRMGVTCPRALIEIPIQDTTIHPEYLRFGVSNSLGLVKLIRPMRSRYMLPICLPTLGERWRRRANKVVFMVDYINGLPIRFESETLAKRTLKFYTDKECRRHRKRFNLPDEGVSQLLCTSGCGVRSGAPIATQNTAGGFELIGVGIGGSPCASRKMRRRLNESPPIFVDVYPYVNWIINVIGAFIFPLPYPSSSYRRAYFKDGAVLPMDDDTEKVTDPKITQHSIWRGREYSYGSRECVEPALASGKTALFYQDGFKLISDGLTKLHVILKIVASDDTIIDCVKVVLPTALVTPDISLGGFNMTLRMASDWFPYTFEFSVALIGRNATDPERTANTKIRGPWKFPRRMDQKKMKRILQPPDELP